MNDQQLTTPVVLVIFNRPATTARVFDAIRQAQPSRLFVIADGPRPDHHTEAEKCATTQAIVERVDWNCELVRNYAETNMGCKERVSSGLQWVFNQVEEAIILEDDCLPHPTFFRFCQDLLKEYRHDTRIMLITGTNPLVEWKADLQSCHFSIYGSIGGWASWRRAWKHFDVTMKLWNDPEIRARIKDVLLDQEQYKFRERVFWDVYRGQVDSWAYPWSFARLLQSGLSIFPSVNLISNVGYGENATHTKFANDPLANLALKSMSFPLTKVEGVSPDREFDRRLHRLLHPRSSTAWAIARKVFGPILSYIKPYVKRVMSRF